MDILLVRVGVISMALLIYGALISLVSLVVHRLQADTGPVSEIDQWSDDDKPATTTEADREIPVASAADSNATTLDANDIPVATVAKDAPLSVVDEPAPEQLGSFVNTRPSDWSQNYTAPTSEIEMAYQNIATKEYRIIGAGKAMLIVLGSTILSLFAMAVFGLLYMVLVFAFNLPSRPNQLVTLSAIFLIFFCVSLLLRLIVQRCSFGPAALAIAVECLLLGTCAFVFL